MEIASATAVKTSGRKEWTNNFCSVRAQRSTSKQLSGPKFINRLRNLAPLLGRGKSSGWVRITLSAGESCTNIRGLWGDGNGTSSRKWAIYLCDENRKYEIKSKKYHRITTKNPHFMKQYLSIGTGWGPLQAMLYRKRRNCSKVSKKGQCESRQMHLLTLYVYSPGLASSGSWSWSICSSVSWSSEYGS